MLLLLLLLLLLPRLLLPTLPTADACSRHCYSRCRCLDTAHSSASGWHPGCWPLVSATAALKCASQVEVLLALRGTLNVANLEAVYEDETHVHLVS